MDLREDIRTVWPAVTKAPLPFLGIAGALLIIGFGGGRILCQATVESKDATIQTLRTKCNGGGSAKPTGRHLSAEQRVAVTRVLDGASEPQTLMIVVEDGCNECVAYGAEWEALFAPFVARGWSVQTFQVKHSQYVNARLEPSPSFMVRSDPNAIVGRNVYLALRGAGLVASYKDDLAPGPFQNQIEFTIRPE